MKEFTVLDLLDLDLREHNHLQLTCIAGRSGLSRTIRNAKIARPGLALSGYFVSFSGDSIQLIGRSEQSYIDLLEEKNEYGNIEKLFTFNVPCFIFIGDFHCGYVKPTYQKGFIHSVVEDIDSSFAYLLR